MTTIRPFEFADVGEAGRLLAARHAAHRQAQPLLAAQYEDLAVAQAEIAEALEREGASGAVAIDRGRLTGYLLGASKPSPAWGPNAWVESAGHAAEDPETMRDLYALAAPSWVDDGRTAHYVLAPTHDLALLDAWYRLGFGQQQAHAIRAVPTTPPTPPSSLNIRRPNRADLDVLTRLALELPEYQRRSPVFSAAEVPTFEQARTEWEHEIDNPAYGLFVAELDGRVVGTAGAMALTEAGSHIGPARADNAGYLAFGAILPEARGRGAGRALGEAAGWWAAESGFDSIVVDWRVTNLLASRTWPRLGFETSFLRLHRLVGY